MSEAFADTSFFVAFLSARDVDHATAVDLMENFEGRIVTTDWVLAELGNFLAKSSIRNLFSSFVRDLPTDPRIEILPADREQFDAGCALVRCASRQGMVADRLHLDGRHGGAHHARRLHRRPPLRAGGLPHPAEVTKRP